MRSMGSTRFFKVARAKSEEGTAVVKVFVIHDVTLSLDGYDKRLEYIKKNLSNAVNCLPFQRFLVGGLWAICYLMNGGFYLGEFE